MSTKRKDGAPRGKARVDTLAGHYADRIGFDWRRAPFVLRITEHRDIDGPVIVVKERVERDVGEDEKGGRSLEQRARLYNGPLKVSEGIIADIVRRVQDMGGVSYELDRFLTPDAIRRPWTLPLDDEAGAKLAIMGKLQEKLRGQDDRIELIARRVAALSREEAAYFFSWIFRQDADKNRWAVSGLRLLFGGQNKDSALDAQLRSYRTRRRAA